MGQDPAAAAKSAHRWGGIGNLADRLVDLFFRNIRLSKAQSCVSTQLSVGRIVGLGRQQPGLFRECEWIGEKALRLVWKQQRKRPVQNRPRTAWTTYAASSRDGCCRGL